MVSSIVEPLCKPSKRIDEPAQLASTSTDAKAVEGVGSSKSVGSQRRRLVEATESAGRRQDRRRWGDRSAAERRTIHG